jgi:TonB-linked SusC/RagA family outer membrane protein
MRKPKLLKAGIAFLVLLLISATGIAQRKIAGSVQDAATNLPLDGATVAVQGGKVTALSKDGGKFEITAPTGSNSLTLLISFVGYETLTLKVNANSNNLVAKLTPAASSSLDDVVVVGYGVKKKINLTGAVATVSAKDIEARPIGNTQQALQGLVPNLNITVSNAGGEPGASMNMNIRGLQSFSGSNAPFVLVDGIPMDINSIDPSNIESMSVLKDAASAAIYGARAAYGVILITTKSGKSNKSGANVNYSTNMAATKPVYWPKLVDAMTFALVMNDAAINQGSVPYYNADALDRLAKNIKNPGSAPEMYGNPNGLSWNIGAMGLGAAANTDWYDILFKKYATHQKHNLSVSNSNGNVDYYISAGLYDEQGLLKYGNESFKRYNFDGKISAKATSWATFSVLFKYNYGKQDFPWQIDLGRGRIYDMMTKLKPTMPAKYPGTDIWTMESRIAEWQAERDVTINRNMVLAPRMVIEPIKGWVTNFDLNYTSNDNRQVFTAAQWFWMQPNGVLANGLAQNSTYYNPNLYTDNYMSPNIYSSYTRSIGNHNFTLMAGYQQEVYNYYNLSATSTYLLSDNIPSLNTAVGTQTATNGIGHWSTQSYFGRLNYNFSEKYLFEANLRSDGSSRFAPDSRRGTFPSVSGGWVLSKEKFFPLRDKINLFKLRVSYGSLGNQNVANYLYIPTMGISQSSFLFGGQRLWTVSSPNLSSINLTWEKVNTTNFGMDISMLKNRLSATLDVYTTRTTDLVGPGIALPALLGTGVPRQNGGEVKTKGFELEVKWRDRIGNVSYEIGANIGDNKSVVTKYNNPTNLLSTYYEGQTIGEIWGYNTAGLFQTKDEVTKWVNQNFLFSGTWNPGDLKYVDRNGDGKIDVGTNTKDNSGDKTVVGNALPRYLYGFNFNVSWKGLDLSAFFQGVGKQDLWLGDLFNGAVLRGAANGPLHAMVYQQHLDYWRDASSPLGANPNAYFPKPYSVYDGDNSKNFGNPTDRYIQNGAYLRMKNIRLGYTIPKAFLKKVLIKSARLYFSGENLLVFKKIQLLDPEETGGRNGGGRTYPLAKSFSFGLDLNF